MLKLKPDMLIVAKDHPEWGRWRVLRHYGSKEKGSKYEIDSPWVRPNSKDES